MGKAATKEPVEVDNRPQFTGFCEVGNCHLCRFPDTCDHECHHVAEISGGAPDEKAPTPPASLSEPGPAGESQAGERFERIPLDWLVPASDNVRRRLGDISGLAESVKAQGVLEPLLVEQIDTEQFSIVAGHRRYAAAVEVGLGDVPCLVRPAVTGGERIEIMLIENLQRADLAPLEESEGYRRLVDLGMKQRTIAERVGCTQAHVSHRLALLALPDKIRKALDNGVITVTDARELTKLPDADCQKKAFDKRDGYRGIAGEVENQLREREYERARTKALGELELAGVRILENQWRGGPEERRHIGSGEWQLNVDVDEHAKLECHAAFVDHTGRITLFCIKPEAHPDELRRLEDDDEPPPEVDDDDPEAEQRRAEWEAERKVREEQRRAQDEAKSARTDAMQAIVQNFDRQAAADFVLDSFIAQATDTDGFLWTRKTRVLELVGLDDVNLDQYEGLNSDPEDLALREHAATSSIARQQVALGLALAVGEEALEHGQPVTLLAAEAFIACLERHGWEVPEVDRQALETTRQTAAAEAEAIAAQRAEELVEA